MKKATATTWLKVDKADNISNFHESNIQPQSSQTKTKTFELMKMTIQSTTHKQLN
jgi:hypothetical protein